MKIKFDITTAAGRSATYALPFSIGILCDLSAGQNELRLRDRRFREVRRESFDVLLARKSPTVQMELSVNDGQGGLQSVTASITFRSIVDFEPEAVARHIPQIEQFVRYKTSLTNLLSAAEADYNLEDVIKEFALNQDLRNAFTTQGPDSLGGLPCWIQAKSRLSLERLDMLTSQISDFVEYGRYFLPRVMHEPINLLRAAIEHANAHVQGMLNQVLGNADFRKLEAAWRSLFYLVHETGDLLDVRVAVLDCTRRELARDFNRAVELEHSALYRHVVDDAFHTLGAKPFGLLIGDHEFSHLPDDIDALRSIADICEAAQAVFATGASPAIFDLERMSDLPKVRPLARDFKRDDYAKWNAFRASPPARRIVMVVPRFLLREPYEKLPFSLDPVAFTERDHADAATRCLWANGAFAFAVAAARSLQRSGWFAQMRGMDSASPAALSTGLPEIWAERLRTEMPLAESRVAELLELGFTGLCSAEGSSMMGFSAFTTCYGKRTEYVVDADWRKRICSSLDGLLSFGRLVHHLKRFCQEKLSANLDSSAQLQIIDTWLKGIDFSESPLRGDVELEMRPQSPGDRLFKIEIMIACLESDAPANLGATIPLLLA